MLLCLVLLSGCQAQGVRDFWTTHDIDYTDIAAAEDRFADYAELAVASPQEEALASLDALFDLMKQDEVGYYIYSGWMDAAFYNLLSPCRNAGLYGKAVDRMAADGILSADECKPFLQKKAWVQRNLKGQKADVPGVEVSERTLVLVLNLGCPSCREALDALSASPQWAECRHVAIGCGPGEPPSVPGWEYFFPKNAPEVFDPELTPVYFVVSADGTVEVPYTLAL